MAGFKGDKKLVVVLQSVVIGRWAAHSVGLLYVEPKGVFVHFYRAKNWLYDLS